MESTATRLFTGEPGCFGGLSNEVDLAAACPESFKRRNDWSDYAMKLFFVGGNISNWNWKVTDMPTRRKQLACFRAVMGSFVLAHEDKKAVVGWMLSEMLTACPTHIPKTA